MKIVIRAGGVGTRLWPVSREKKPKQLHALLSNKTMLQEALERSLKSVKVSDIYISGNKNCETILRKELGAVLEKNLILEPSRRETAAAIGLESVYIKKSDPKAIVASLGSDHAIKNDKEFARLLSLAEKTVQNHPHRIVCLGIKPTCPDVGYGYIQLGKQLSPEVYHVTSFHEKPILETAKKYVAEGNYLWNANMFVWRVDTVLKLYEKYLPKMYKQLSQIEKAIGTVQEKKVLSAVYPKMEKIAIDYAIIEKTQDILAIPADVGWSDIGDWARLKDELSMREEDNVIKANHLGLDTKNTQSIPIPEN
ncbi:MAG: mannose-1-phosphate guanylyltransferase [Patescibacteria group bacterium]|jgi:mannose-1-phosphate guanylyltransferase